MKRKVKEITRKTSPLSFSERIRKLTAFMRGWVKYYKYAHIGSKLAELYAWVRNRLRLLYFETLEKAR